MERAFEKHWEDRDIESRSTSAHETLEEAYGMLEQIRCAVQQLHTTERQGEIITLDVPREEVEEILVDIQIDADSRKHEIDILVKELLARVEYLLDHYENSRHKQTGDFLRVLVLKQAVLDIIAIIHPSASDDAVHMV